MRKFIDVTSCDSCQRVKAAHHKPRALRYPTHLLEAPQHGHDNMLVVVDSLTKMVHVTPTTKED